MWWRQKAHPLGKDPSDLLNIIPERSPISYEWWWLSRKKTREFQRCRYGFYSLARKIMVITWFNGEVVSLWHNAHRLSDTTEKSSPPHHQLAGCKKTLTLARIVKIFLYPQAGATDHWLCMEPKWIGPLILERGSNLRLSKDGFGENWLLSWFLCVPHWRHYNIVFILYIIVNLTFQGRGIWKQFSVQTYFHSISSCFRVKYTGHITPSAHRSVRDGDSLPCSTPLPQCYKHVFLQSNIMKYAVC